MIAVERNFDLAPLNTLNLPGQAALYCRLTDLAELTGLPAHSTRFILGGGSNLLLVGDFEGLIVHVGLSGKRLLGEDGDAYYVEAAAGENWHDFVEWTLAQGWPGLENLALIPGQVGAAPIQNIGAYGLEAGEMIAEVRAWDFSTASPVRFSAEECRFGYRDSLFKQRGWHLDGRLLITSVLFRLPRRWQPRLGYADLVREFDSRGLSAPTARQVADAIIAIRRNKLPDPAVLPNAGSFFENPVLDAGFVHALRERFPALPVYPQADGRCKVAAGWLIEQAGWKGRDLGPLGMFEKQALVLVHRGGGNGNDALRLIAAVQADVESRFGIRLKPEPVRLGSEIR